MINKGNKVTYIGPIPNDTFQRNKIYEIIDVNRDICTCDDLVVIKGIYGNTSCDDCKRRFNQPYFSSKLFKSIFNKNINIEIL